MFGWMMVGAKVKQAIGSSSYPLVSNQFTWHLSRQKTMMMVVVVLKICQLHLLTPSLIQWRTYVTCNLVSEIDQRLEGPQNFYSVQYFRECPEEQGHRESLWIGCLLFQIKVGTVVEQKLNKQRLFLSRWRWWFLSRVSFLDVCSQQLKELSSRQSLSVCPSVRRSVLLLASTTAIT